MLPPIGYPYWSAHRTLRTIAEEVSRRGHLVLRIDYDGTGDSAGGAFDAGRLFAWRRSVVAAAAELRRLGCRRVSAVGARLGATLALMDGVEAGAEVVVAWAPVIAGRRYTRELRLLSSGAIPDSASTVAGAVVSGGTVFSAETMDDLSRLSMSELIAHPVPRVVLIDPPGGESDELCTALRALGCDVEYALLGGGERALESPTEYATVPHEIVESIVRGVGDAKAEEPIAPPAPVVSAQFEDGGRVVREEVVRLGPRELVGIVTEPAQLAADASTFLFLNSGSEPHIGPGRAWVEYARALAAKGHAAVRVDFSGWGESPDLGHAPGRPYDPHGEQELIDIVEALQGRGYPQVVVVGLCAGAWIALRVASRRTMAGVVALNPQLYWRPGDPVEALMSETRARRTPDRRREERGRRLGIWTMLDVLRLRPSSARWLAKIDEGGTPTLLLFAEDDDGIEYLRNRCGRCLSRVLRGQTVRVAEIPGIDHSMHRVWLRDRVIDALADFSETLRQPTP